MDTTEITVTDELVNLTKKLNKKLGHFDYNSMMDLVKLSPLSEDSKEIVHPILDDVFANPMVSHHRTDEMVNILMVELARRGVKKIEW